MDKEKQLEAQLSALRQLILKLRGDVSHLLEDRNRFVHAQTDAYQVVEEKTHYLRIAEALLSSHNKPRPASWLASMTGLSRTAVSQVLHGTHRNSFNARGMPGYSKKLLWWLTEDAEMEADKQLQNSKRQTYLFEGAGEFDGVKAVDCCVSILSDSGNEPTSALTLAREALKRGYHARAKGSPDEILLTTAKSFWAALGRDDRFVEVRPLVFALRDHAGCQDKLEEEEI